MSFDAFAKMINFIFSQVIRRTCTGLYTGQLVRPLLHVAMISELTSCLEKPQQAGSLIMRSTDYMMHYIFSSASVCYALAHFHLKVGKTQVLS